MKRLTCLLAAILLLLGISACGTEQEKNHEGEMGADDTAEESTSYQNEQTDVRKTQESNDERNILELNDEGDRVQIGQFDFERKTVLLNSGYEMPLATITDIITMVAAAMITVRSIFRLCTGMNTLRRFVRVSIMTFHSLRIKRAVLCISLEHWREQCVKRTSKRLSGIGGGE